MVPVSVDNASKQQVEFLQFLVVFQPNLIIPDTDDIQLQSVKNNLDKVLLQSNHG